VNPGFVYILTNEAMPGIVKIGRTGREVDVRAAELWQTGVPQPFEVYAKERAVDCVDLEWWAHALLSQHRVHRSREFFRVDPWDAHSVLQECAERQAQEWVERHFDAPIMACLYRTYVSSVEIERLAKQTGHSRRMIADALESLTAEEIQGAIQRAKVRRQAEHEELRRRAGIPEDEIGEFFDYE
jgi:uncharacterized protein (DUF433 family)